MDKNGDSMKEVKGKYGNARTTEYKINYKIPALFNMLQGRG
jgi:hypothetical protein